VKVTPETLTDEMVQAELARELYSTRDPWTLQILFAASHSEGGVLGPYGHHAQRISQADAHQRICDAINARAEREESTK
jgi:hypothetical protein